MPPETCPNCGTRIPARAKCCPECGADEETGWSDSAYASGLGLPDEEFDYDEFVRVEFGGAQVKPRGIKWIWYVTAVILLIVLVFFWLRW